jgi:outer membrane autotransporter protein
MNRHTLRAIALASIAVWAGAAQTQPAPSSAAASAAAGSGDDEEQQRKTQREKDKERIDRAAETTTPQAVSDAPTGNRIPGQPPPKVQRTDRGPLNLRRTELSFGFDHSLSRDWAIGGVFGQSRSRVQRVQTEEFLQFPSGGPPEGVLDTLTSDTEVRTRASSAALTLSWFPLADVFIDGGVSTLLTHYDASRRRIGTSAAPREGSTRGSSLAYSLGGGFVVRRGAWALIPQAGLDSVRSEVDAIDMGSFTVGAQSQRTESARLGLQLQRAIGQSFGTLTPYAQIVHRRELGFSAEAVQLVAPGTPQLPLSSDTRVLLPENQLRIKQSSSLGLGLLLQWTGGVSGFVEWSGARGSLDLRESRVAAGVKLER